jgi:hypothetical protein
LVEGTAADPESASEQRGDCKQSKEKAHVATENLSNIDLASFDPPGELFIFGLSKRCNAAT